MSAVATSADQATDLIQKLSENKASDTSVVAKKPSLIQYGPVNVGQARKVQMPSLERSSAPVIPSYVDPNAYFIPNGYPSTSFYFGGYDGFAGDWDDYAGYLKADGVDLPHGVYGDMYQNGYGYAPYGAYPFSVSSVPSVGHDSIIYGNQHYQYPSPYFQSQASLTEASWSKHSPASQGDKAPPVAADQPSVTFYSDRSYSNGIMNGIANGNGAYLPQKHSQQSSSFPFNGSYGRGALSSGQNFYGYQDPCLSFDAMRSPVPWYYGPASTNPNLISAIPNAMPSTASHNACSISTINQNKCLNSTRTIAMMGEAGSGMMNKVYPSNMMYGQHGNAFRDGSGLGSQVYDSRMNCYGFYGHGYENFDGMSELNRGPRANLYKLLKGLLPTYDGVEDPSIVPNREQYNRADFPDKYADAKFFVIKSYSEDDIHRSIKHSVWTSTPSGNKKLDATYKEAMNNADECPVFLFFSVNTSGQFIGLAEMVGPVDFNTTVDYWQQDKWIGCFNVKWHIVKDVPNSSLRHITLEYNDNKPMTNSRDTQEVKLDEGLQVLKIFKDYGSKTSILDDFGFYETREKVVLEKRARQQQYNKQFVAVKLTEPVGEKDKETANSNARLHKSLESAPGLKNSTTCPVDIGESSDDNCLSRVTVDIPKEAKSPNEFSEIANAVC